MRIDNTHTGRVLYQCYHKSPCDYGLPNDGPVDTTAEDQFSAFADVESGQVEAEDATAAPAAMAGPRQSHS